MNRTTAMTALTLLLLACAPVVSAQEQGASRGQDNEFGSIRTPYSLSVAGTPVDIEAQVMLRRNYEDKEATFFMFAWTVRGTPLTADFTNLVRTDNGQEMPCAKREADDGQVKCFVDRKDMPPVGTEIVMRASVGATRTGSFQIGAIVVPFTYSWTRVPQSNGLDAELYGDTLVDVQQATGGSGRFSGLGNTVPAPGPTAAVGILGAVALGLAALRRSRSS